MSVLYRFVAYHPVHPPPFPSRAIPTCLSLFCFLLNCPVACTFPHTHTHTYLWIFLSVCVCVYTLTCVNVYLQVASAWCVRGVCGVCVTVDVSNCCFVAGSSLGFHTLPQGILRLLRALRHLAATLSLCNSSTHCNINKYTNFQYCCCCTCRMCWNKWCF